MEVQSTSVDLKALWDVEMKLNNMKFLGINVYHWSLITINLYLHNNEQVFLILSNLQTDLFRIDLPKIAYIQGASS